MRAILSCIVCICLLGTSIGLQAQSEGFFKSPRIVPASPEAAALYRFSETPVDYSSGAANITVPLYTMKVGRIVVPIAISYSTGGVKVQDIAGMVGLGWTLSWGGSITERGENLTNASGNSVDENLIKTAADVSANINYMTAFTRLRTIQEGAAERQKPEYAFNFGGYSGVFFFDVNNQVNIKSGNHNLKIEKVISPENNPLKDYFRITTDNGIEYTFGEIETALAIGSRTRKTGYFVTAIEDLMTGESVYFQYASKPAYDDYSSDSYSENREVETLQTSCSDQPCSWPSNGPVYFRNHSVIWSKRITTITSSQGTITFTASADRLDLDATRITDIAVTNAVGATIKRIKFNQSHFISNASLPKNGFRLKLDGVSFYNADINKAETYVFGYNSTMLPAYSNGSQNATGVDYWGFYNGKNNNSGLIPSALATQHGFGGGLYKGDRSVDPLYTQACMLNKITHPTGGYTEYSYENNKIVPGTLGQYVGGVRVKKIAYYGSPSRPALIKEYKYNDGIIPLYDMANNFVYQKTKWVKCYHTPTQQACPAAYLVKYISSSPVGLLSYYNMPAFYNHVEEYTTSGIRDLGKTIYKYDLPQYVNDYLVAPEIGNAIAYERKWENDKLLKKIEYYKTDNQNSYSLVKTEESFYTNYNQSDPIIGLHVVPNLYDAVNGNWYDGEIMPSWPVAIYNLYQFKDAKASVGIRLLTSKKVTEYAGPTNMVTTINYEYDNAKYQLKKSTTTNSKGETISTVVKYPYSLADLSNRTAPEDAVLQSLVQINNLTETVELETYNGTNLLDRKRAIYDADPSAGPALRKFKLQTAANPIEDVTEFTKYNSSDRLLEFRDANNIFKSFLWDDYDNPTAEVINASQQNIGYTSFEYEGILYVGLVLGNWTVNYNGPANNAQSNIPMGKYCFPLAPSNTLTKTGLTAGATYTVSYWSTAGSCTVLGSTGMVQGKTIGGWTNYIHTVTNVTTVTVSGNSGFIDELRLHPVKAQMTTYDYVPQVGLVKACDVNNMFTRYEYDDMGYLTAVRDNDNNIVNIFARKYKDIITNANSVFANVETYKSFTKNDCTTGGTGSTVIYTIPTGTFTSAISQADADQLATNELWASGQAYANTHGICTYLNEVQRKKFYKNNCDPGYLGTGVTYSIDPGMFSSNISLADANQLALNEVNTNGQSYANTNGSCVVDAPTVGISYSNQSSPYWFITGTNIATGLSYTGSTGSYYTGTLTTPWPRGTYNITFSSSGQSSATPVSFTVGESFQQIPAFSSGPSVIVTFSNVVVNAITANPLISIHAPTIPSTCAISANTGWLVSSHQIYKVNATKGYFYMLFRNTTGPVSWSMENVVATMGGCAPSTLRTFNYNYNGRTWEVKIYPNGQISIRLISGQAPVNGDDIYITNEYTL